MKPSDPRIPTTVALVALTVWVGGLLALGAIVAPVAFGTLPRDLAAGMMAIAFARFDKVAMGAAAVVLGSEAWRLRGSAAVVLDRASMARVIVSVIVTGLACADGLWLTPTITTLHTQGAVRGVGEAGAALASAHALAEQSGKAQVLLAIALIALHVYTLPSRKAARDRSAEANSSA